MPFLPATNSVKALNANLKRCHPALNGTRSSATADGPRDALCQLSAALDAREAIN